MKVPFLDLKAQYQTIRDEIANAIQQVVGKTAFAGGPFVEQFENEFTTFCQTEYAIGVNSGTSALWLALLGLGVGQGDEVITAPNTFIATAEAISFSGAKPVFVDIEEDSYNISAEKIEEHLNPKVKAIIPVHFGGLPCDMDKIYKIAKENDLVIIEDAAHAVGAEYKSKKIGSMGNPTCFSFYPTKNITSIEGGMVCLNDDNLAEKIKIYSNHGLSKHAWQRFTKEGKKTYEVIFPGYKYNMTDVNAAIIIHQLERIENINKVRAEYAKKYLKEFEDFDLIELPPNKSERKNVWHLFPILLKIEKLKITRDQFVNALDKEGIGSGIHYNAIHEQQYYKNKYSYKKNSFKRAEYVSERTVSIPLQYSMDENDVYDVVKAVKKILNYYKKKCNNY